MVWRNCEIAQISPPCASPLDSSAIANSTPEIGSGEVVWLSEVTRYVIDALSDRSSRGRDTFIHPMSVDAKSWHCGRALGIDFMPLPVLHVLQETKKDAYSFTLLHDIWF
jgi:hypothetical protein